GNILSMSKGFGYVVTQEIKVSRLAVYPVRTPVRLKGVPMIGFKGIIEVNFEIPDLIGLGKSVSRGFGTVQKVRMDDVPIF
ncbi:MAG: CRISPR-associated endonuclease Cas6, partial [Nitrospirales bacterium]|nr:CRISPR-associated endonuclease Cas6 [Nitrospirales bacterium]